MTSAPSTPTPIAAERARLDDSPPARRFDPRVAPRRARRAVPGVERLRAFVACFTGELVAISVHIVVATFTAMTFVVCGSSLSNDEAPVGELEVTTPSLPTLGAVELELLGRVDPREVLEVRRGQDFSAVIRHQAPEDVDLTLHILAVDVSSSTSSLPAARVLLSYPSRRLQRVGSTLRYQGPVDELLPLRPGTWQLTFLLGESSRCEPARAVGCREKYAWVRIGDDR